MDRGDGAGQAHLGHLGYLGRLTLGELCVGRDDAQRGILKPRSGSAHTIAFLDSGRGIEERSRLLGVSRSGKNSSRLRVHNIPESVHHDDGSHNHPPGEMDRTGAQAPLGRPLDSKKFSDARPGPRPKAAFLHLPGMAVQTGLVTHGGVGADPALTQAEIENDSRRDDGNFACRGLIPDVLLFEIPHDASGGIQPKRAAAGEKDRVDLVDEMERVERVRLPGPGS